MSMFIFSLVFACGEKTPEETEPEVTAEPSYDSAVETPEDEAPPEVTESVVGEGHLYPEPEASYRHKKRMKIAHVKASMERVSGGILWEVNGIDKWSDYYDTLGVPDYEFTVQEDRTVSVMFQKFLDDAAAHTCTEWIQQESNGANGSFFSEIEPDELDLEKIRLNMVALRRLFHGQITPADAPIVDSLVDLHYTVVQRTNSLEQAWTSVCIGLFTHPDFFMY